MLPRGTNISETLTDLYLFMQTSSTLPSASQSDLILSSPIGFLPSLAPWVYASTPTNRQGVRRAATDIDAGFHNEQHDTWCSSAKLEQDAIPASEPSIGESQGGSNSARRGYASWWQWRAHGRLWQVSGATTNPSDEQSKCNFITKSCDN
jgi:hypothetical protein